MNVILIPNNAGTGRHVSFSPRQVALLAVVALIALPMVIGTVAYHIQALIANPAGRDPAFLASQYQQLRAERLAIEKTRRDAAAHLDALAQRVGHLQAHVMRLNALGSRLTRLAGLDRREFDFSDEPAVGGPETSVSRLTVPDFLESLEQLSAQVTTRSERLEALEQVMLDRKAVEQATPMGWPADGGWLSSSFGRRSDPFTGRVAFHEGVDIASKMGSPIRAMGVGVVTFAGEKTGYGLMVEVNHGQGQVTRYAHAQAVLVKVGDRVTKGQSLALVGSSGRSTGPHLHLEVLRNGQPVNPQNYLRADKT